MTRRPKPRGVGLLPARERNALHQQESGAVLRILQSNQVTFSQLYALVRGELPLASSVAVRVAVNALVASGAVIAEMDPVHNERRFHAAVTPDRRPKPSRGARLPHLPEAAIPLLGTVSDREVATRTGTTARVVAAHRKARRIKPVRSGPKPVAGATRDQRHSYWVSPEESAAIHLAIEVAQRPLSDVARELMLAWARAAEERVAAAALPLTEDVKRSIDAGWAPTDPPTT